MTSKIVEVAKEEFNVDKEHWNEILQTNRKKVLSVFLAGSLTATIVWLFVFFIYISIRFGKYWFGIDY